MKVILPKALEIMSKDRVFGKTGRKAVEHVDGGCRKVRNVEVWVGFGFVDLRWKLGRSEEGETRYLCSLNVPVVWK